METEAQSVPEAGAERDDVHADVRAAFESFKTKEVETDAKPAEQGESRTRNEQGQFTKADSAATQQPAEKASDADPAQETLQQSSQALEAPTSWSADAKAKWATLDPSIQAEIARREKNMSEGGQKWSEEKRGYEETLAPVRTMAQRYGVNEREGLNRLLAANDYLERDPQAAIAWLAQSYGVDLSSLNQTLEERPKADPMVSQLHQELNNLKASLQEREAQEIHAELSKFASAPGHEHFDKVRVPMGKLISQGLASSMEEAYEKAVWADPELRASLIAAQTATQQADRKAKEQADKARRGAISVNGSPSTGATPVPKREYETVEEATRAAWATHMGR